MQKCTIKFIRFNPVNNLEISNSEYAWISKIKDTIHDLRVKTYAPPGREVGSSCGEFTKHYYHEEIETEEYELETEEIVEEPCETEEREEFQDDKDCKDPGNDVRTLRSQREEGTGSPARCAGSGWKP